MATYRLEFDGTRLRIPPMPGPDREVDFSTWSDSEPTLERFCRKVINRRRPRQGGISAEVALVHRPDNTYNGNAISVAAPASLGGDIHARHMGYMYDAFLREVGMPLIADLAEGLEQKAGRPVEILCTGTVWDRDTLTLDLPDPAVLRQAIIKFLGLPPEYSGSERKPAPKRYNTPGEVVPRADRKHTSMMRETDEALAWLGSFATPHQRVGKLVISLQLAVRGEPRRLHLTDAASGRDVGTVVAGFLFLEDERDRYDVLQRLEQARVKVAQPTAFTSSDWPTGQVPNMWTFFFPEGFDLRPRNPESRSGGTVAVFNPTSRTLWVEDSRLVAATRVYAARVGMLVTQVGLSRVPWELDSEIPYYDIKDEEIRKARRAARDHEDLHSPSPELLETDTEFADNERFVTERGTLVGSHTLTGNVGDCRLCDGRGMEFTAVITREPLTYCHACLHAAANGVDQGRDQAVEALRKLGQVEFDDVPMLEAQLDTLHLNPAVPVVAKVIDELLTLRTAIPRRKFAWTLLLESAGFAADGLRTSRGTLIRARDGHLCLSLREKAVCEFLHQNGIEHDREPHYPPDSVYNPRGRRRADWILTDGTLVELWGMPNDPAYAAKMVEKRKLAGRHGLGLVELTDAELPRLPEMFAPWLPRGATAGWTWTPVVGAETAKKAAAEKLTKPRGTGDASGRNDFNAAAREQRLQKCRDAVELQADGLSRKDIGELLEISLEGVAGLLRDGKFFADPASDPARLAVAECAAAARAVGQTRAVFAAEQSLTKAKAQEAWRDAEVVASKDEAQQSVAVDGPSDAELEAIETEGPRGPASIAPSGAAADRAGRDANPA